MVEERALTPTASAAMTAMIESNAAAIRLLQQENRSHAMHVLAEALGVAQNTVTSFIRDDPQVSPVVGEDGARLENGNGVNEESGDQIHDENRPDDSGAQGEQEESSREEEHYSQVGEELAQVSLPVLSSVPLVDSEAYSTTEPTGTSADNMFSLYNRAIEIDVSSVSSPEDLQRDCVYQSTLATVLYNLGMLYHQHGLRRGQSSSLHRSFQLYEMAFSVVEEFRAARQHDEQHEHVHVSLGGLHVDLLVMALCNNAGHLQSYFNRTHEANLFHRRLQSLLAITSRTEYPGTVEPDDISFFRESICASSVTGSNLGLPNRPASAA